MQRLSNLKDEFQALLYKANQKESLQLERVVEIFDEVLTEADREMLEAYLDKLEADVNEKRWKKSIQDVSKNPKLVKLLQEDAADIEAGSIDDGIK